MSTIFILWVADLERWDAQRMLYVLYLGFCSGLLCFRESISKTINYTPFACIENHRKHFKIFIIVQ